jgi:hypothetical protein
MSQPVFTTADGSKIQAIGVDGRAEFKVTGPYGHWLAFSPDGRTQRNPRTLAELAAVVDLDGLAEAGPRQGPALGGVAGARRGPDPSLDPAAEGVNTKEAA